MPSTKREFTLLKDDKEQGSESKFTDNFDDSKNLSLS